MTNGFSNAVVAFNTRATRYDAVYLTVDKPYTGPRAGAAASPIRSPGRASAAPRSTSTIPISARRIFPQCRQRAARVVVNGMVDIPWGLRLSGLMTYGSGIPSS